MICKICNSNAKQVFNSKILKKYDVKYFKCDNCGYLFTEQPYWLDEAYSRSINLSDTGLLDRNIYFSKVLSVLIYFCFNKNGLFLDYAGGYGVFTRLMRDIGFNFYWHDPYTQNLFANGFEKDIKPDSKFELITAFEVFEHLVSPKEEIEKMLSYSTVSYTHLRAHETVLDLVCRLLLEKKKYTLYHYVLTAFNTTSEYMT